LGMSVELPPGVDESGIAEEWRSVLNDNLNLAVGSVCKLPDSELAIDTGDNKPFYKRQYPIAPALMPQVRTRVQEWIDNGWVVEAPPNCPWNSPLLAAKKPSKEPGVPDDIRLCLDARYLNERIVEVPDSLLPLLREVIDKLGQFEWITVIDLADSYHQFKLRPEDCIKTAFTLDGKQYMFVVVPFGLKVMTGHMQRIMERLLGGLGIVPFQDDTGIASKTAEDHIAMVKQVLEKITYEAGLRIRLKKCKFFRTEARLLGMSVSRDGVRMDPQKVTAILNWSKPVDGKSMQRFLGAANFHREFSSKYATVAAPLEACRYDRVITWTAEREHAFEQVKAIFAENILLRHIDWDKKMYLTTDASLVGVGAWIGQINDEGKLVPVLCASRKLSATEQRWAATKRELYALMWAMKKFRHYLLGRHFVARVDHKPLVNLLRNKMTLLTEGWMDTILEYSFSTEYLEGTQNELADALSRSYDMNAISIGGDEEQAKILWQAELRGCKVPPVEQQLELIQQHHSMGHFGTQLLFAKIVEAGFWWPQMRDDITSALKQCDVCQQYNYQREGFHPALSITADSPYGIMWRLI